MKHPLPQGSPRGLGSIAVIAVVLLLTAVPAAGQDTSDHERHRHFGPGAAAALRIEVHIVPYSMTPPKHHQDDGNDAAVVYNMPSRYPAMSLSEQERLIVGKIAFGSSVIDAGPGAVLKTTTVVPE